jgi:spermidine/putrescine transport system ATP-binding protein
VLQIGTPVVIYERPNCRFVADFIGATNFLNGKVVTRQGDKAVVAVSELGVEITGLAADSVESGKKAVISIRPEKMHIAQKPDTGQNAIAAKVVETAYIGSDTRFILNAADGTRLSVWEQNTISTLDLNASYYQGQEVWVTFPHGNTLVLPE